MSKENCCNPNQINKTDFTTLKMQNDSDCGCGCDSSSQENQERNKSTKKNFDIVIDGKPVTVSDSSMNLVEVAKSAGISIPAPCYFEKKKKGCCKSCLVEIDKKQSYACATKPTEGMQITVNREDLKALRKERLLEYKEAKKNNSITPCCLSTEEKQTQTFGDHYAKSNPDYLKSMFGKTDIMPLWLADMDFKVAEPITEELKRLVERANYAYEFNEKQVFDTLVNWNKKRHNLDLESKSFLQVSGVLTGIGLLIRELSKENDGVMVQTPVYHQFFKLIETANRKVVENPLKVNSGNYTMDFQDMEQKIKKQNVKIVLLCNPHNPIGRVWKRNELQQLIALANEYNVTIISDEIHSDIIYSNVKFNSIASFANSSQHIAIIGSPAKTFGMHSIANGYIYVPNEATHRQLKNTISSLYLDHGNALSLYATLAAYNYGEKWLDETIVYMEKTINWVSDYLLKELPQVKLTAPEGTYQIWLDFSALNLSPDEINKLMVHSAKLALTPGTWFGDKKSLYMRMNIASPFEKIQNAFYQIKNAIDSGKTINDCNENVSGRSSC